MYHRPFQAGTSGEVCLLPHSMSLFQHGRRLEGVGDALSSDGRPDRCRAFGIPGPGPGHGPGPGPGHDRGRAGRETRSMSVVCLYRDLPSTIVFFFFPRAYPLLPGPTPPSRLLLFSLPVPHERKNGTPTLNFRLRPATKTTIGMVQWWRPIRLTPIHDHDCCSRCRQQQRGPNHEDDLMYMLPIS